MSLVRMGLALQRCSDTYRKYSAEVDLKLIVILAVVRSDDLVLHTQNVFASLNDDDGKLVHCRQCILSGMCRERR